MAEARGRNENQALANEFARICEVGGDYLVRHTIDQRLTKKELRFRSKVGNVAGLQIADLFASPSAQSMRHVRGLASPVTGFGERLVELLQSHKYDRDDWGTVRGFGQKWMLYG